ncbi:MAG: 3-phosphoshikimate 1-carboxyvinyltransferase [Clostridia bacterium]|nr:3-phosphoshikimate 1-carboxyvinyltransferase [Clostridia bacterium]
MQVTIEPGRLSGCIPRLPSSKSHVHRLLIAAALSKDATRIYYHRDNADISATAQCLKSCGVRVEKREECFQMRGPMQVPAGEMDCGESGSTLRFLLPLCACLEGTSRLIGRGRLPARPNGPLLSALREHGTVIAGDYLPLSVGGGLRAGTFALPGDVSSQYFTGLLFALPLLCGDSELVYTSPLESKPYVELTLSVLRQFGIAVEETGSGWRVPGKQAYASPGEVYAEADWSAAAFWLAADALGSAVAVSGLNGASCQGDKAVENLLRQIGGEIDVSQTPDLMPILSAAAAASPGKTTRITGAARLRLKESDRLTAMAEAIRALGGYAEELADGLSVHGTALKGGTVDGKNDHRVVMSAAIAATACQGPVTLLGAEAVDKSYPDFWNDFAQMGGRIHA